MIDTYYPRPDRDFGSIHALTYVSLFQELGYHVHFIALMDSPDSAKYRHRLEEMGVTVPLDASPQAILNFLTTWGDRLTIAFLSRVGYGGRYINEVVRHCPKAKIIFNTVDLHFLRQERHAALTGDRVAMYQAASQREREIYVSRMADAVMVVSSVEKTILEVAAPGARIFWCPLILTVEGRTNAFDARSGVAFVGGYSHAPNEDAVRWFLDQIWPLVGEKVPGMRFYAVGADLPEEIRTRADQGFVAVGHVEDLKSWLERVRLTIAPLRYGAGAKGKVLSSLTHGVPCVVSTIAAEGMAVDNGGIVLADDPMAFANAIVQVHEDQQLWETLSDAALRWAESTLSIDDGRDRLIEILEVIGAPIERGVHADTPATRGDATALPRFGAPMSR